MEFALSLSFLLSIALCARIIWGNKKLALAEYEIDDLCDSGANTCFKAADLEEKCDRLEKLKDQYANDWYAAKSEFGDAMAKARARYREAEDIANDAMVEGLRAVTNARIHAYSLGMARGIDHAIDICQQYPTSRGSTLVKRIAG